MKTLLIASLMLLASCNEVVAEPVMPRWTLVDVSACGETIEVVLFHTKSGQRYTPKNKAEIDYIFSNPVLFIHVKLTKGFVCA